MSEIEYKRINRRILNNSREHSDNLHVSVTQLKLISSSKVYASLNHQKDLRKKIQKG